MSAHAVLAALAARSPIPGNPNGIAIIQPMGCEERATLGQRPNKPPTLTELDQNRHHVPPITQIPRAESNARLNPHHPQLSTNPATPGSNPKIPKRCKGDRIVLRECAKPSAMSHKTVLPSSPDEEKDWVRSRNKDSHCETRFTSLTLSENLSI